LGNKPAPEKMGGNMRAREIKGTKSNRIIEQRGRILPKIVQVKYEWADAEPYLVADEDIENMAEKGETVYVGEYRLVKVQKVSLDLKIG
jgi:hypothetical protein